MIYHYCLCVPPLSLKLSSPRRPRSDGLKTVLWTASHTFDPPVSGPLTAIWTDLLAVNKLIHMEASCHFFKHRIFEFWELHELLEFSTSSFSPACRDIRHLEICLAGDHRLESLGFVSKMLRLDSLTISFDYRAYLWVGPRSAALRQFIGDEAIMLTETLGFDQLLQLPRMRSLKVEFFELAHSASYETGIRRLLEAYLLEAPIGVPAEMLSSLIWNH